MVVINGATSYKRLEEVFTHAQEFCNLQHELCKPYIYKCYDTQSTNDVGILYHLGNSLDRSDIARDIPISATDLVDDL